MFFLTQRWVDGKRYSAFLIHSQVKVECTASTTGHAMLFLWTALCARLSFASHRRCVQKKLSAQQAGATTTERWLLQLFLQHHSEVTVQVKILWSIKHNYTSYYLISCIESTTINQSTDISFIHKGTLHRTSKYSYSYTWSWLIC